jgi:hypothetical protein
MPGPASPRPPDAGHGRAAARVRTSARPRQVNRPVRGTAPRPDVSTRVFDLPDPTAPVFVDKSGRRSRRLRRIAYWVIALALTLLALWWLSQVFLTGWKIR